MPNIKYLLFKEESELFESISEPSRNEDVIIAVVPTVFNQIQMIVPSAPSDYYYYKIFLIQYADVFGIHYIHSQTTIPKDFPDEYKKLIDKIMQDYFVSALRDPRRRTDINHSIYEVYKEEAKIAQPQPLLFSQIRSKSPIVRDDSVDIEIALEQLEKEYDRRFGLKRKK